MKFLRIKNYLLFFAATAGFFAGADFFVAATALEGVFLTSFFAVAADFFTAVVFLTSTFFAKLWLLFCVLLQVLANLKTYFQKGYT